MFKKITIAIPLGIFLILAGLLSLKIGQHKTPIPSPLINKEIPNISLPVLEDETLDLKPYDLHGQVYLLNVWASWCLACQKESPVLESIKKSNLVKIYGLNYKDENNNALVWLNNFGNPYELNLVDKQGQLGLDLGVYGVPETFIIDKDGVIREKIVGELTSVVWEDKVKPLIKELSG